MAVPRSCLGTDPSLYWTLWVMNSLCTCKLASCSSMTAYHTQRFSPLFPDVCSWWQKDSWGSVDGVYQICPCYSKTSPAGLKHLYWGQSFTLVTINQVPNFTWTCYMLACRALLGRKEMLRKNWDSSCEEEPRTSAWGVREGRQKRLPSTRTLIPGFYWQPHVAAVTQVSLNVWQVKSRGTVRSGT